ncbi:hypothetical protein LBMAG42_21170 [Deltaproteobacteria bacterium]|nr:hypothetical protein LBMAG42_21170 [Deltaproteobacteria bacterium]
MLPNLKLPAQVSIVCAKAVPPLLVRGRCVAQNGDELSLEVPSGTELPANAPLIIDFTSESGVNRAIAAYLGKRDGNLLVQVTRVPTPDKREYPRMNGGITLRYHVLPKANAADALDAWMRGGKPVAQEHEPDPFMNFSVTGLAFDDLETCAEADVLAFVITVPGAPHSWRGAAVVVRVSRIPIDERDDTIPATHRVAVEFTEIPDDARVALGHHTERIQEAWL